MKKILFCASLSLIFLQINAQCTENAGSFGNNSSSTSYNISGNVSIILNSNNTVSVNFANNFSTASGPDVRLYLVNSEGKSISELKSINPNNLDHISFGLIGFSGAQSYTQTIPNNKDITKYDTVFFYCLQFNAFWDLGKFNSFNNSTCSVLKVNNFTIDSISYYPNPAKDKIQLSNNDYLSAEIRIFNALGKQMYHQLKITEKTIDISSFIKGIYIVKITVDGKSKTQKLVVQ